MTNTAKLALTSASVIVIAGATFAVAQTRSSDSNTLDNIQKVAELATEDTRSAAADTKPALPTTQTLSKIDQELLLSLLNPASVIDQDQQLEELKARYSPAYIAPTLEIYHFAPHARTRRVLLRKLIDTTGEDFGTDINAWYRWLWNQPEIKTAGYDLSLIHI